MRSVDTEEQMRQLAKRVAELERERQDRKAAETRSSQRLRELLAELRAITSRPLSSYARKPRE
jgi:prefoldin subunit 5